LTIQKLKRKFIFLFNDAIHSSDFIALNVWMICENELKECGRRLSQDINVPAKIQLEYKSAAAAALPLEPTFSESSEADTMLYSVCYVLPQFYDHSMS
jgi:hypothetical protein